MVDAADLDNAVRMAATEAPASDPIAQQAVIHVAMNRADQTGSSLSDVITAPHQFTGYHTARAQTLSPDDALYKTTLANIQPALNGQTKDPTNGATLYLNPTLQKQNGAAIPTWADPNNRTAQIGPHVFYKGDFPNPTGQHGLPPTSELDQIFGVQRPAQSTEAAQPSSAAMPDQATLDKAFGVTRPAPTPASKPPESASMQAARAAAQKAIGGSSAPPALETFANSVLGGLGPVLEGGEAAALTGTQNALANVGIGKPAGYSAGEAYTAARDALGNQLASYYKAHPVVGTLANIAGFATPGGVADLATQGVTRTVGAVAPRLATNVAGRIATRAAGYGAAGGLAGGAQAVSEGANPKQVAEQAGTSALTTAALGQAGEGLAGVAGKIGGTAAKRIIPPVVGALAGAGLGYAQGGKVAAETGALTGGMLGHMASRGTASTTPTAADRATALDLVAKANPTETGTAAPHTQAAEALETAHPLATTAEALGGGAKPLLKSVGEAGEGAVKPINEALEARSDPEAKIARLSSDAQSVTGINPQTAQATVQDQIAAARAGPAKQAYDQALTGQPVWNDTLKQLASEPEVAKAMNNARRLLGSEAMVPNPAAEQPNAPGAPQERMTSAELKARMTKTGAVGPGQEVTTNDLLQYLKSGGPAVYDVAPEQPPMVPSDRMWDLTKQMLDTSVTRDAFGRPEISSENRLAQQWSSRLKDATNDVIPGLKEARAQAGEYLSAQKAYDNGTSLWSSGKTAETADAFADRYAGLTPAEQQATQRGYMAEMYRRMEKAKEFDPGAMLTPFHKAVQETLFGGDRAAQLQASLQREQALAASAKQTQSSAKPSAPAAADHGVGPLTGATMGLLEGGGIHGAIRGAAGGAAIKSMRGLGEAVRAGKATPAVRHALGEILAQPPQQTARELRLRRSAQRGVTLSKSTLGKVGENALRGVAVTAGKSVAHALAPAQ